MNEIGTKQGCPIRARLEVSSVEVIPSPLDFLKAANLMQTMTFTAHFEAGHELHLTERVFNSARLSGAYTETQPPLLLVQVYTARAGVKWH